MKIHLLILLLLFAHGPDVGPLPFQLTMATCFSLGNSILPVGNSILPMGNQFSDEFLGVYLSFRKPKATFLQSIK